MPYHIIDDLFIMIINNAKEKKITKMDKKTIFSEFHILRD